MPDDLRISPSETYPRQRSGAAIMLDVVQPNARADLDCVIAGALCWLSYR